MEFAERGDLQNEIVRKRETQTNFSEKEIWHIGLQILEAVNYLHTHNIIHRDIKCLNLFIFNDNVIKLGDLGVSKIILQ
jgi:NIMA (never in mitosis gene a)-related kinase